MTAPALTPLAEVLQCLKTADIVAALAHQADLALMLRRELSYRGLDAAGEWVGFVAAAALLEAPAKAKPGPAPEILTSRFELSHRRMPRGYGSWLFETRAGDVCVQHTGLYAEAKRAAVAYGRKHGLDELFTCP
jgi:hypothetical protein